MGRRTGAKLKATVAVILFIMLLSFLLATLVPANADRGGFGLSAEHVSETGQMAIAAWNGTREMLLLSTDVSSSEESEVVEIMPLPSNPSISKGETDSFLKVKSLVNTFFLLGAPRSMSRVHYGAMDSGSTDTPQIEITFQEIIGAHYLTVVKVEQPEGLTQWLGSFLEDKGYSKPLPSGLGSLLENYTKVGIKFFAVDMITTNSTVKTVEPLTYEFNTTTLYYPLQISSLFSGNTEISLFTLTNNALGTDSTLTHTFSKRAQFQISQETLGEISPSMKSIFSGAPYLCYFYFSGSLNSFNDDLMAKDEPVPIESSPAFTTSLGASGFFALCLLFTLLHSGRDKPSKVRWLETISTSTGLIGLALVCIGLGLPWGLAESEKILLPQNGVDAVSANASTGFLFFMLVGIMICCFVYISLQDCSHDASVFLTVLGTATATMIIASNAYLATVGDGFFVTLAGATSFAVSGILSRWRIKLSPSQPPITGFKAYITRKLLKALFVLFGVSWIIFWILHTLPPEQIRLPWF